MGHLWFATSRAENLPGRHKHAKLKGQSDLSDSKRHDFFVTSGRSCTLKNRQAYVCVPCRPLVFLYHSFAIGAYNYVHKSTKIKGQWPSIKHLHVRDKRFTSKKSTNVTSNQRCLNGLAQSRVGPYFILFILRVLDDFSIIFFYVKIIWLDC